MARVGSSDNKLRSQVLDRISFETGESLVSESDCSPQQRTDITELVSILERREASYYQAKRELEAERLTPFWRKAAKVEHESKRIAALHSYEKLTDEYETKVKMLGQSVKAHLLTTATTQIDFERFFNVLKERGIVLQKIECPNCGGILEVSEVPRTEEVLQCKYCGKSILAVNLFEKFKETIGL